MMSQNQLGQILGSLPSPYPYDIQQYPFPKDTRTDREKLNDRLNAARKVITQKQEEIKEIEEAIKLLDQNPLYEKMTNMIRKILG